MATDSPFLLFKVECPICRTVNEFETIRVGAYAEEGRDTDFCPQNVKWRFPRYQGYNPLVFFTATCGNCFYTREFTNQYKDWKNDNNFKTYRLKSVKTKHLDGLADADSIIKMIGSAIDLNRFPNESAILKLHLAIYDEQLADHYSRLDVGRFYLRVAWIFRDMAKTENPGKAILAGLVSDLEKEYRVSKSSMHETVGRIEGLVGKINAHFDASQISAEVKADMLSHRDRFNELISEVHSLLKTSHDKLTGFSDLIDGYRQDLLGSSDNGSAKFGNYSSFDEFLQTLRGTWNGIVTNEREALEKSVYYYKEAFANGRDIAPGNQQIQASYLIAELSRRIGDFDEARQYFTSTIKSGQEFIYQNRNDSSRTALAKKILELAIEQGRQNLAAARPV